jgi:protein-S-isoprenylcysteine O-methyltransferase Ste14
MKPIFCLDNLFVGLQLILFILFSFFSDNLLGSLLNIFFKESFLILIFIGLFFVFWAIIQLNVKISIFPSPKSDAKLVTDGAYKYLRHPIYTGLIIVFWGYSLYSESLIRVIISLILIFLFNEKAKFEESKLSQKFPDYKNYMKKTWRIFPFIY